MSVRQFIGFLLASLLSWQLFAQPLVLDSLKQRLNNSQTPLEQVNANLDLALYYKDKSLPKVLRYADEAMSIAKTLQVDKARPLTRVYLMLSTGYLTQELEESALFERETPPDSINFSFSENLFTLSDSPIAMYWNQDAQRDVGLQVIDKAMQLLNWYGMTINPFYLSLAVNKANIQILERNWPAALRTLISAEYILNQGDFPLELRMIIQTSIGLLLAKHQDFSGAKAILLSNLALGKSKELYNYQIANLLPLLSIFEQQEDKVNFKKYLDQLRPLIIDQQAYFIHRIEWKRMQGLWARMNGNEEQAIGFFQEMTAMAEDRNIYFLVSNGLMEQATSYLALGDLKSTEVLIQKVSRHVNQLNNTGLLKLNTLKSTMYEQQGKSDLALKGFRAASEIALDIQSTREAVAVTRFKIEQELTVQQRKITSLEGQQQESLLLLSQQRTENLILLTIGGLLGSLVFIFFRARHKLAAANQTIAQAKQELEISNNQLFDQNEELAKLNFEKDKMLHIVSHDLQSPISTAQLLNQLINRYGPLNEKQQEYQQLIGQELHRGSELIRGLMQLYLFDAGKSEVDFSSIDLRKQLIPLLDKYDEEANNKRLELAVDWQLKEGHLQSDERYFIGILDNLLSNAIKFSPAHTCVQLRIQEKADYFCFQVQDQGPGFTEEDKQKLFRNFQKLSARPTAGEPSNGLGLALTKAMTNRLGGRIELLEPTTIGACFQVILPKQPSEEAFI